MSESECSPIKFINVTETDIKKGIRQNSQHCPIARALKRKVKVAIGGYNYIAVGSTTVTVIRYDSAGDRISGCEYDLPAEASRFVKAFDKEGAVPDDEEYADYVHAFQFSLNEIVPSNEYRS